MKKRSAIATKARRANPVVRSERLQAADAAASRRQAAIDATALAGARSQGRREGATAILGQLVKSSGPSQASPTPKAMSQPPVPPQLAQALAAERQRRIPV